MAADIQKLDLVDIELNSGALYRSWMSYPIGMKDNKGNGIGIRVFRGGQPVTLTSVSVQGYFRDPRGNNIPIINDPDPESDGYWTENVVSGNVAYVVLPAACYNYDGQFCLAIKLVGGGVTGTMRIVDGMVDNTNTTGAVAPAPSVATYDEVLAGFEEAMAVIEASVRYDVDQSSKSAADKAQARANIEVAKDTDVVRYDIAQSGKTALEKAQARANIDAADVVDIAPVFNTSGKSLTAGSYVLDPVYKTLYRLKADVAQGTSWSTSLGDKVDLSDELIGRTSELKSAVDELNNTVINDIDMLATDGTYNDYVDIAWVQGKPTLSNGAITFDSDTKSINSGYIAVEPSQTINLSVPSLYKAIVYYVDKNDNTYSYSNSSSWITGTTYTNQIGSLYHYAIIRVVKTDGAAVSPSEIRLQGIRFYTNKESQLITESEFNPIVEDYSAFKEDVEKKIDSEINLAFSATRGRIVISGGAITIQSNTSFCYTSYINMTNLDIVYIRVPSGYKICAYLADNTSGTHVTYDPSNPTNGYVTETTAVIEKDTRRPYLIVSTIKDPSGTITPTDVTGNIDIYYKNTEDVFTKINAINPMTPNATSGQILYIGDTAVNSGHIDNAVMYNDGIIIAARSNGKVVRIGYDGTEETVLQLTGSNFDWRGLYIDSNENVYASPHASVGSMDKNDRGLYRLAKGASTMTKVISLYNTSSSVTTETENNDDTIWTMCEDKKGNLYAGVYAHTVRANPAIYKSTDGGVTWSYLFNFKTSGLASTGMHIHTIIYSKWKNALYCIVGEVNTIFKSTNGGTTWTDLEVKLNTKGSSMVATPYGIFIGSDGAYNCDIDLLYNDDITHQRMYRGIAGTVFALRVSDLTGFLYAFTKIDSSVNSESYYPPATVLDGTTTIEQWEDSVSAAAYNNWLAYHDSVYDDYPDDSIRPQHYIIIISRNGGRTWEPLKRFTCSSTYPNGLWTTGYFKNGECLTGRIEDGDILNPIIISEGKHKYVASGCDLSGEILIRTNESNTVEVL